ncbi:MAG: translation initiation factor IF-2 [Acidobacteria bacterium]|nr:translation initiation factor IF-2 [Acidobacteriota bacterium]
MATVRIYKVAELLGLSSHDAMTLLKQETGIDVKSASSSIEEIVARQFVERQARKRNITLPAGPLFADTPVAKKPGGKAAPEPPAPATTLRPRLVKTVRPSTAADEAAASALAEAPAPEPVAPEPSAIAAPVASAEIETPPQAPDRPAETPAAVAAPPAAPAVPAAVVQPEPPVVEPEPAPPAAAAEAPRAVPQPQPPAPAPAAPPRPMGRLVPPTRRLRIEDPLTGEAPAARPLPTRPPIRPPVQPPAPVRPSPGAGLAARPGLARPSGPAPRPPLGGPRPLPSQPIRPAGQQVPGRPPMSPQRPGQPQFRAPAPQRSRSVRRDDRPMAMPQQEAPPPITKLITLAEGMTVKDLADKLEVKVKDVLKKLMDRRMMMTINSTLDAESATTIARDFGAEVLIRSFEEELTEVETGTSNPADLSPRAPVVTVMGHVDHGKTTLLDAIRETKVAEREAGGITQHIGAYAVNVNKRRVVFLDTPGHEAFTMMRARGARVTDIVVLVVAADDGVMPQTKEAIDHAKAANVPIVVAVNKIDKADANPERVKRELSDLGLMPEEWGGSTVTVEVSARQRKNLDQLLEMILLVADLADLKANPKRMAQGTVLEAKLDRGRGPVAHVLVQDGTLSEGDLFIAGTVDGKVRALFDDLGRKIKSAGPSTPVEVLGLSSLPAPGDTFQVVDDPIKVRQVVAYRQAQAKEKTLSGKGGRLTLESLQQQMTEGGMKELPIVIKADVQGSAEVLADTLTKLSDDRVKIRIIHTGVGAINESDVLLATASNAIVIGFNVRPDRNAADVADREEVDIRQHSIIYQVTDEIRKAMSGLLEPTLKETRIGVAEVRQLFKTPKAGAVAGCIVTEGRITRSGDVQARLVRDGAVVWQGRFGSLRRFKDDVSEVKSGMECGITLERFSDVKPGDLIEAFMVERVAQAM